MSKVISKGRNTWDDGSVMNYKITDEGIMYISGVLPGGNMIEIRSKADFHHIVFMEHWPLFSENDQEPPKDSKVITVKRGSVKLSDYCRMQ